MNPRSNPFFWSFSLGTWFQTRVRVSWFLPIVLIWPIWKFGWPMGSTVCAIALVTVLLHEFSHTAAARAVGIEADEILLWPLGGLAFTGSGATPRQQILISGAGPFCNLLICLAVLYPVLTSARALAAFNPLFLPVAPTEFLANVPLNVALLAFSINWMLLLINLIPACPLDGGQMLRSALAIRLGGLGAFDASTKLAMAASILLGLAAMLFLDSAILVGLSAFLLVWAVLEVYQLQAPEQVDDSFMGYDFSQGYTSLEKSQVPDEEPPPRQPGFFERWKKRREDARARREAERNAQAAQQLDALLAKVHEHGLQSLTEAEKQTLKQVSDRLRSDRKPG